MKNLISNIRDGLCVLAACLYAAASALAQSNASCPEYPRAMDEVYVCFKSNSNNEAYMVFSPRAVIHNPVKFVFPDDQDLFDPATFVDFGDGGGFVAVNGGDEFTITYPDNGEYEIQFDIGYGTATGIEYWSGTEKFQVRKNTDIDYNDFLPQTQWDDIVSTAYTPPTSNAFPSGSPYNNASTGGGIVHILYANQEQELRKPFIIVEGFDPISGTADEYAVQTPSGQVLGYGRVRWDVLVTGREESFDEEPDNPDIPHASPFELMPALFAEIQSRGYDIVYVDFADAGTYIQANANFLRAVIARINEVKVGSEENVLLGASMGGIVCRLALAQMEQDGEKHCTKLFFTFDTPHNGANVPVGLQALAWFFNEATKHDLNPANDADDRQLWNALNTPAARQMVVQQLGVEVQAGRITPENPLLPPPFAYYVTPLSFSDLTSLDYSVLRNTLATTLHDVGWPKQPRKIALLNGMKNGAALGNMGFNPGDKYYDASLYANTADFGTAFKIAMRSNNGGGPENYRVNIMDDCNKTWFEPNINDMLFTISKPYDFNDCLWGETPYKYNVVHFKTNANLPYLDNAPGGYRMDILSLNAVLKKSAENADNVDFINPVKVPRVSFVPTWSSLAMNAPLNNQSLFVDLNQYGEQNMPSSLIPNFDNFYAPGDNLRHVELDEGMKDFVLQQLDNLEGGLQAGTLNTEYNYGLRRKTIPSLTITGAGKLNINNVGFTGYVLQSPELPSVKPVFTTYIGDCGNTIEVNEGGQFNIGALDKSQHGVTEAWSGSTVHIRTGGTLRVTSSLSALIVKEGATLILDEGANVILESPESRIRIEGTLQINGDIRFAGLGFFDFAATNELVYGPGNDAFKLTGTNEETRFIRLDRTARLVVPPGKYVDFMDGAIEYSDGAALVLDDGSSGYFTGVTFYGDGSQTATAITGTNPGDLFTDHCHFTGLEKPVWFSGGVGQTELRSTVFDNYIQGAEFVQRPGVLLEDCQLTGTGDIEIADYALRFLNCPIAMLRECIVQGHEKGNDSNTPFTIDPLQNPGTTRMGVQVDGGWFFYMQGGEIRDCDMGIANRGLVDRTGTPTNVVMDNFATVRDCRWGIVMQGNATVGQVAMTCGRLINNHFGVYGEDVRLTIDPVLLAQGGFGDGNPNTFIRRNHPSSSYSKFFRICYRLFTPPNPIPATRNYWAGQSQSGSIQPTLPNPSVNYWLCQSATCNCEISNVLLNASNALTSQPTACNFGLAASDDRTGEEEDDCGLLVAEGAVTVREQFLAAFGLLTADAPDTARTVFGPVSDLWASVFPPTHSNACITYIQSARSFVEGLEGWASNRLKPGQLVTKPRGDARIFPNPTSGILTVKLPATACQLTVFDAFGRETARLEAAGEGVFDSAAWPSGLYTLEIREPGKRALRQKIFVQKL